MRLLNKNTARRAAAAAALLTMTAAMSVGCFCRRRRGHDRCR